MKPMCFTDNPTFRLGELDIDQLAAENEPGLAITRFMFADPAFRDPNTIPASEAMMTEEEDEEEENLPAIEHDIDRYAEMAMSISFAEMALAERETEAWRRSGYSQLLDFEIDEIIDGEDWLLDDLHEVEPLTEDIIPDQDHRMIVDEIRRANKDAKEYSWVRYIRDNPARQPPDKGYKTPRRMCPPHRRGIA